MFVFFPKKQSALNITRNERGIREILLSPLPLASCSSLLSPYSLTFHWLEHKIFSLSYTKFRHRVVSLKPEFISLKYRACANPIIVTSEKVIDRVYRLFAHFKLILLCWMKKIFHHFIARNKNFSIPSLSIFSRKLSIYRKISLKNIYVSARVHSVVYGA